MANPKKTIYDIDNPPGALLRWEDRAGDWIDYDSKGSIMAYGNANGTTASFVYEEFSWAGSGAPQRRFKEVKDRDGNTVLKFVYDATIPVRLLEVKEVLRASESYAPRSVKYEYQGENLSKVTDARGFVTSYGYDEKSRLNSMTDAEGRTHQIEYGPTNRVKKETAADGAVTEYVYDYDKTKKEFFVRTLRPETASGRQIEESWYDVDGKMLRVEINGRVAAEFKQEGRESTAMNSLGLPVKTSMNEFGQVSQITHPDQSIQRTSYAASNLRVTEKIDEEGVSTKYAYDDKGNLKKKTQAAGTAAERVTLYENNDDGQPIKITTLGRTEENGFVTPDSVWQIEYDARGKWKKTTDPEGNVRQYSYRSDQSLQSYTDALGNTTSYEVDARGNLTKVTNALGHVRTITYDKVGNTIKKVDERGKAIQLAYDALNRVTQATNSVGGVYKLQYNKAGVPITETDEDGRAANSEFDNFMRITKEIDALGNITQYNYQPASADNSNRGVLMLPTEVKYPTYSEKLEYDQRERVIKSTLLNPNSQGTEGLVTTTAYSKRGEVISSTDANGHTRYSSYNSLGQLIESTDSLGKKTKAVYDARGNLIQITDAKGNVNKFEFDRNNKVIKEILPLGQTTSYAYDANGNLSQRIDANGHKTSYTYDGLNRLVGIKQYKGGDTLVRSSGITRDEMNNITGWTDTDHTRNQTSNAVNVYDDNHRKISGTVTYPSGYSMAYGYSYSDANYKTKLTWPDGTVIGYAYGNHGSLENVTIPGEGTISVNQFKWLAPSKVTLPGGTVQEYVLDGLFNLEALKVKTPDQQTVLSIANTFGKVEELKQNKRSDNVNGVSSSINNSFTYDDEDRLNKVVTETDSMFSSATESFTLDAVGNRVAHSKIEGAWTYDANNRLLQRGTGNAATSYEYDETGNQTKKTEPGNRVTLYSYDTRNRLTEVKDGNGNLIARYGYDPVDRRLWKEQFRNKDGSVLTQAKRSYFLYADEGLIAEASQSITLNADQSVTENGSPIITAQFGVRPGAEFTTGLLFVKAKNSNQQDVVAYFHNDQQQTPVKATDKQGNVVWAAKYNAFGQASIMTPNASSDKPTISINLRFPGQVEDIETGLHYNFRRYYDPEIGRYISQDPIGIEGGLNLYRYAEADPVNATDPTGECPMCAAYAICVAECMIEDAVTNAITGECNNFGDSAKECAVSCLGGLLGRMGKWGKRAKNVSCSINSFSSDTLVHVKPSNASRDSAKAAKAELKPISDIKVGDEVLAMSEWKDKGNKIGLDERLSYEKVTDIFSSHKLQTVINLSLDNGETLTATAGHPFMTADGWKDAVLLKNADVLVLKLDENGSSRFAKIVDIASEEKSLPVFNIEVANAHTYFVGKNGELVHNEKGCKKGQHFRGGKKKDRDNWYGKDNKDFQKWWHRDGKREFGGEDIQDAAHAQEAFDHWVGLGKPVPK